MQIEVLQRYLNFIQNKMAEHMENVFIEQFYKISQAHQVLTVIMSESFIFMCTLLAWRC